MKKTPGLLLLLLIILLAACGGQTAQEATAVPTEAVAPTNPPATEAPSAEPSQAAPSPTPAYIDTLTHTADPALVNVAWQWVQRADAEGMATVTVPDPQNYTILFDEGGTFSAQLDCNNGSGRYATTPPSAIFMELGPVNMAACSDESLAVAMANLFGPAQTYRLEDNGLTLVLEWAAGGGSDTFRHPDAPAVEISDGSLTGTTWYWVSQTTPVEEFAVNDPARYTIQFNDDNTATIVADCNTVAAEFSSDDSALSITVGAATFVACPADSVGDRFLAGLENAAGYSFAEGDLLIEQLADGETMRLTAVAPAAAPTHAATAGAETATAPAIDGPSATVTAADGIFVRSGPGTQFPDIGVAATNEVLPIIGRSADGGWWAVAVPLTWSADQQGWISAQFVAAAGTEDVPVVEGPAAVPTATPAATADPSVPTATPGSAPTSTPGADASGGATGILFRVVSFGAPGGEQSLIESTNITATFSNTDVVGSAGCNDYTARLTPVADYFTIGPVAATENVCTEPAGIMEQEQAFLAALAGTDGYDWATQLVNENTVITAGVLRYTLADGSRGVINLVAQ